MIKYSFKFFITFITILFSNAAFAQFNYKLNIGTGFYKTIQNSTSEFEGITAAFEGTASYKYKADNRSAQIELKIKPETFGFDNALETLKFIGSANFYQREKYFTWGINFSRQAYNYNYTEDKIYLDRNNLNSNLIYNISKSAALNFSLGYTFQKVSNSGFQKIDIFFADAKVYKSFSPYFNSGFGLYFEKFNLNSDFVPPDSNSNKGFRFGPEVSINYLKNYVFKMEYKFLFHQSDYTNNPSYSQWFRLLAGKYLTENLSAFFLGDIYLRNFKVKSVGDKYQSMLYTSANLENRVYLKLGYDISGSYEVYLKSGYFKENIFDSKYTFEGWNLLFGVELAN